MNTPINWRHLPPFANPLKQEVVQNFSSTCTMQDPRWEEETVARVADAQGKQYQSSVTCGHGSDCIQFAVHLWPPALGCSLWETQRFGNKKYHSAPLGNLVHFLAGLQWMLAPHMCLGCFCFSAEQQEKLKKVPCVAHQQQNVALIANWFLQSGDSSGLDSALTFFKSSRTCLDINSLASSTT